MITTRLIVIPVGISQRTFTAAGAIVTFPLQVICDIEIDGNQTTSCNLADAIDTNPLWSLAPTMWGLRIGEFHQPDRIVPISDGSLHFVPTPGVDWPSVRARLKRYLFGEGSPHQRIQPLKTVIDLAQRTDRRFEDHDASRCTDTNALYRRALQQRDAVAYQFAQAAVTHLASMSKVKALPARPTQRFLRALNALAMRHVLDTVHPDQARKSLRPLRHAFAEFSNAKEVSHELQKLWRHLHGDSAYPDDPDAALAMERTRRQNNPSIDESELVKLIQDREPNVLLRNALKDPALAKLLGLVSQWECTATLPIRDSGDAAIWDVRLYNNAAALAVSPAYQVDLPATRCHIGREVAPAPFLRDEEIRGALAHIDGGGSEGTAYLAVPVAPEHALSNAFLGQVSNSLKTSTTLGDVAAHVTSVTPVSALPAADKAKVHRDPTFESQRDKLANAPPQHSPEYETGINQSSTRGISLSMSLRDLMRGGAGHGAYWLEDLWLGYRIDVARYVDGKPQAFQSLSAGTATYALPADSISEAMPCEGYFDRDRFQSDRPVSTTLTTWNGVAPDQGYPLAFPRWLCAGPHLNPTGTIQRHRQAIDVPRLTHGTYDWRARLVFTGGTGLSASDADVLLSETNVNNTEHAGRAPQVGTFSFPRVEGYSPGDLVTGDSVVDPAKPPRTEETILLLGVGKRRLVYLIPRAIGIDEARFLGILGNLDDAERYKNIAVVSNARAFAALRDMKFDHERYFMDPAVSSVWIDGEELSGNPAIAPRSGVVNGALCELIQPYGLFTESLQYGERGWEHFEPIELQFVASDASSIAHSVESGRGQSQRLVLALPPGTSVRLTIRPKLKPEQLRATLIYENVRAVVPRHALSSDVVEMAPMLAERTLRVVHATLAPLRAPVLDFDMRYLRREESTRGNAPVFDFPRDPASAAAYVVGRVRVHAPTTGQVRFQVTWCDIDDDTQIPVFTCKSMQFIGKQRAVIFAERERPTLDDCAAILAPSADGEPLRYAELFERLEEVCAENACLFTAPGDPADQTSDTLAQHVDLKDGRRRLTKIVVRARARYAESFSEGSHEQISAPVVADARNQTVPANLRVSHVLPTFPVTEANFKAENPAQPVGLRIYTQRPMFTTGFGERCAIGCMSEDADDRFGPSTIKQYATEWGEDPFARAALASTTRIPRAADFLAPEGVRAKALDPLLYPLTIPAERSPVLYIDDVPLPRIPPGVPLPRQSGAVGVDRPGPLENPCLISLASFAVQYDANQQLFYADIIVAGGFFGWIKFALYRHQPHSVDGCHLSANATLVYASVVYDDPIVQSGDGDWWLITVGPVFDKTVTYFARKIEALDAGVLIEKDDIPIDEQAPTGTGQRFFSLRVPVRQRGKLLLIRCKKGVEQHAIPL